MRSAPNVGIILDQYRSFESPTTNWITNVSFSNFETTCRMSAAIVTTGPADYWSSGHTLKGLKFSANTNPIWLTPRINRFLPWDIVSDSGEQSQFFTLFDSDGSVIGAPGYIVANNPAIIPPDANTSCTFNATWNAYKCPGTCYRSMKFQYIEPGFSFSTANKAFVGGDGSYMKITRLNDSRVVTVLGNLNSAMGTYQSREFYVTLLADQTYQVAIIPPTANASFYPSSITFELKDPGRCGRGLTLQFLPSLTSSWTIPPTHRTYFSQCAGTASLDSTRSQFSYLCGGSGVPATLQLAVAPAWADTLILYSGVDTVACTGSSQCSFFWSGQTWSFDESGIELRPLFYNPLTNTTGWKSGVAPVAYASWKNPFIKTWLMSLYLSTYYFRRTFTLTSTGCYSALVIDAILNDGIVVYLNNQEMFRANMPNGPIMNVTNALVNNGAFPNWQTFKVPLPGVNNSYFLAEGVNTVAVELHAYAWWVGQLAFDMRVSAIRSSSCSNVPSITPEICDGVDNNFNGKIDEDATTGALLTRPCKTPCGPGIETCLSGYFQNCTAPPVKPDVCNNIDDDCDGLIDNGPVGLNCPVNQTCSMGQCLPTTNATTVAPIFPVNSTNWYYYDKAATVDPTWLTGNVSTWPKGAGPLGFNNDKPSWDTFNTTLRFFTTDTLAVYFVKQFNLTSAAISNTFNLDFNIRRTDGAAVYVNGVEMWRSNLPDGILNKTTAATSYTNFWTASDLPWSYQRCTTCSRSKTSVLKAGMNWIAVELHVSWYWKGNAAFDMELFRNQPIPCNTLPGAPTVCARQILQVISPVSATWQYSDGSLPIPPSNWTSPTFNASSWKTGDALMAYGNYNGRKTTLDPGNGTEFQRTYYFRRTITVLDALCYSQINSILMVNDGAVIYMNGVEMFRSNTLPATGPIDSTTFASTTGNWQFNTKSFSGGWLKKGTNVIAIELHRASWNKEWVFFDWQMTGLREAFSCTPLPP